MRPAGIFLQRGQGVLQPAHIKRKVGKKKKEEGRRKTLLQFGSISGVFAPQVSCIHVWPPPAVHECACPLHLTSTKFYGMHLFFITITGKSENALLVGIF